LREKTLSICGAGKSSVFTSKVSDAFNLGRLEFRHGETGRAEYTTSQIR